ncbi:MAG: Poly(3-hydroxybutyrate) depolymerase, partial [Clostridiales bacterium]|nr:Poly(3-hydroxybutyrate) depolymerase [Clostridiales bacterium]
RGAVKITKTIAGLNRYWYEYIPASVKKDPNKKVPLLVASHGSGGNGQTYMAQSEWYEVAEARGFIVVFPTAYPGPDRGKTVWPNWNLQNDPGYVADDVGYIMEILKDTKSKYSIDDSRIYAAGHSMGSMLSFLLGATHPETFAAIAPCSGRVLNKFSGIWKYPGVRYDLVMPIWADMGENENGNIVADDETERTLKHYLAQNHIPDGIVPAVVKTGKYTTETYYDATGKIPLVNYSALENFPHAFIPEMAWKIWDEFLSKYSRNSDGTVNYSGNTDIKAATNPGVKAGTIFNDLKSHWSQMIMVRFASRGLISGFSDGTIKPDEEISKSDFIQLVSKTLDVAPASLEASAASSNKITREDAAAIIYKAGKDRILKGAEDPVKIKDIDQVSASSKSSVEALIKACIIKGNSDGTFRPKNNITRAEAVALLSAFVR